MTCTTNLADAMHYVFFLCNSIEANVHVHSFVIVKVMKTCKCTFDKPTLTRGKEYRFHGHRVHDKCMIHLAWVVHRLALRALKERENVVLWRLANETGSKENENGVGQPIL